jgi:hypothetical protein
MSITRYGIVIEKFDKIWYFITEEKTGGGTVWK